MKYDLSGATFADDFHVFAVEWTNEGIRFLVDETAYHARAERSRARPPDLGVRRALPHPESTSPSEAHSTAIPRARRRSPAISSSTT